VRGDLLEALYQERVGEDPIVYAVRYRSQKKERTYRAYRFKPPGSQWPRSYSTDGEELELRFTHPPLDDYDQVTSLVHDGRGHKGVDFKTPVGTAVRSPFEARVVRKNWHFRATATRSTFARWAGAASRRSSCIWRSRRRCPSVLAWRAVRWWP